MLSNPYLPALSPSPVASSLWRKGAFVVALLARKSQTSGDSIFRRGTKHTKKFNAERQRRRDAKKNFKKYLCWKPA